MMVDSHLAAILFFRSVNTPSISSQLRGRHLTLAFRRDSMALR